MDPLQTYPIRRFEAGRAKAVSDTVIAERWVELNVNDGRFRVGLLCLPQDLEALAVGFLATEGLLKDRQALQQVQVSPEEDRIIVRGELDEEALASGRNRWTWGSGCGSSGTSRHLQARFAPIEGGPSVSAACLTELGREFQAHATLWRQTGGVHACALADRNEILLFAEDVGRNNAFDKITGRSVLDGIGLEDKLILTTGRISAEIVAKAAARRLSMVVSRSAVTSLAADIAGRCNITLVGFLRGRKMNVYSGLARVVETQDGAT